MFQEAWCPVLAKQQRQPQWGLAAANIYMVHWAAVAAIAHSQADRTAGKLFVWSAASHELLAWLTGGGGLELSQTGGRGGKPAAEGKFSLPYV